MWPLARISDWPLIFHVCCHRAGPGHLEPPLRSFLWPFLPPGGSLHNCRSRRATSPFALRPVEAPAALGLKPKSLQGPWDLGDQNPALLSTVLSISISRGPQLFLDLEPPCNLVLLPRMLPSLELRWLPPSHPSNLSLIVTATDRPPLTPVSLHLQCHKCHFTALPQ